MLPGGTRKSLKLHADKTAELKGMKDRPEFIGFALQPGGELKAGFIQKNPENKEN